MSTGRSQTDALVLVSINSTEQQHCFTNDHTVCMVTMSVVPISLLVVVQFTSQLNGAVVQRDSGEDSTRSQDLQLCLDSRVTDLARSNQFCANKIERFLTVAQSKPENFTFPQDVINGICNSTCYWSFSLIYQNCTEIAVTVSDKISVTKYIYT